MGPVNASSPRRDQCQYIRKQKLHHRTSHTKKPHASLFGKEHTAIPGKCGGGISHKGLVRRPRRTQPRRVKAGNGYTRTARSMGGAVESRVRVECREGLCMQGTRVDSSGRFHPFVTRTSALWERELANGNMTRGCGDENARCLAESLHHTVERYTQMRRRRMQMAAPRRAGTPCDSRSRQQRVGEGVVLRLKLRREWLVSRGLGLFGLLFVEHLRAVLVDGARPLVELKGRDALRASRGEH